MVVFRQVQYTKNRPVGYSRDRLIQAEMKTLEVHNHFTAVRNDLLQSGRSSRGCRVSATQLLVYGLTISDISWRG